jgi:antitoxin VapB
MVRVPVRLEHPDADKIAQSPAAHRVGDELRAIGNRCAALPDYDTRSPEDIIGFDEHGIPR